MLSRRSLMGALSSLIFVSSAFPEDLDIESLVHRAIEEQDKEVMLGGRILPPEHPAWREAYQILQAAPAGKTPYEVAQYFKEGVPPRYQQAWPEADANPIIVEFFWDMKDKPAGDTTPWCSAFVNWCLRRSGIKGTENAGSQSFINRNWGTEIWKKGDHALTVAKTGDVVVFRHQSDPAHGHVAFFKELSKSQPNQVEVLGGNQLKRIGGRVVHLVDYQPMKIMGELELISIRTMNGLRMSS